MDINLQMESVLDRRVADAIRRRVRTVRRQFAARGEWRVTVWSVWYHLYIASGWIGIRNGQFA
jgi:hypothetical protein